MLKKNNRTKNSSSTHLYTVHKFKQENETKKIEIYSKINTEFLFLSLFWVVKKEKYFTILKLSIYTVKEFGPNPQKCSRWNTKEKAQLTVLCRGLKLMPRHGLLLMARDQSRPLPLSCN